MECDEVKRSRWRLEPETEMETLETKVLWNRVEGVPGRRASEAPGEEVKSPKRKVIRVESEETQDYVREAESG